MKVASARAGPAVGRRDQRGRLRHQSPQVLRPGGLTDRRPKEARQKQGLPLRTGPQRVPKALWVGATCLNGRLLGSLPALAPFREYDGADRWVQAGYHFFPP